MNVCMHVVTESYMYISNQCNDAYLTVTVQVNST